MKLFLFAVALVFLCEAKHVARKTGPRKPGLKSRSDCEFCDGEQEGFAEPWSFETDTEEYPPNEETENVPEDDKGLTEKEESVWPSDPWTTDNEDQKELPKETTSESEHHDCQCMSILQCGGARLRGAELDLESEENICPVEGDVCCPVTDVTTEQPPPTETYTETSSEPPPSLNCGEASPIPDVEPSHAIGDKYSQFAEFPWTVLLFKTGSQGSEGSDYRCAGSLVRPNIVLTAAHCIAKQPIESILVRAGEWDLDDTLQYEPRPVQEREISRIVTHPKYVDGSPIYDIGLIVLKEAFKLTDNVNTICLPASPDEDFDHNSCVASGWGKEPNGREPNIMKKIEVPIVPRKECQQKLRATKMGKYFKLHQSFTCAGGVEGQDVCLGDGGGPLACKRKGTTSYLLVGVTSWGIECGKADVPGIYSNVPYLSEWVHYSLGGF